MIGKRRFQAVGMIALWVVLGTTVAEAGLMSRLAFYRKWFPKNRVDTLLVTGNYARSRLLAEVAQRQTRQPVLLVSPAAGGGTELYFLPAAPEAMILETSRYVEFIDFLQPRRLVFLGDAGHVPPEFVDMLRARYATIVLNSADWKRNASELADMLNAKSIAKLYAEQLDILEEALSKRPDHLGAPMPANAGGEPLMFPMSVVPAEPR